MKKLQIVTVIIFGLFKSLYSQNPTQIQVEKVLNSISQLKKCDYNVLTAKYYTMTDLPTTKLQLDTLINNPKGDMFWMYSSCGFYFNTKNKLDSITKCKFRELWKKYTPYRGDTENHFLMYYSSLLLFSQEWKNLDSTFWFNGKSSIENYNESKEYLENWINESSKYGITEWDSPRYTYYYITPLILLHDFVQDPILQNKCTMMLELILADYSFDYLNGNYCGAHSRDGDNSVINPLKAESTSYGQLFFEDEIDFILPDLVFAALSNFKCPQIIKEIAHNREKNTINIEQKLSRAFIRFSDKRYKTIFRYNFMTPNYCMGSISGDLIQPIQQHSFDITFNSKKHNNTIFSLNPQSDSKELGMFFPEEPELIAENIIKSKASYGNENKWIGGSFYEKIYQFENTLLSMYSFPTNSNSLHSDLYIPKTVDTIFNSKSGWIFCLFESTLVAIYPIDKNYKWIDEEANYRIRSFSNKNGYIFECSNDPKINLNLFKNIIETKTKKDCLKVQNSVFSYKNYKGIKIKYDFTNKSFISSSSQFLDYNYLFKSDNCESILGSGVIKLSFKTKTRTIDFTSNRIY